MTLQLDAEHITAYAAALAGLVYLARFARAVIRKLDAINAVTSRELEHNHGSSIKDDIHGIAVAQGKTQRDVDELKKVLYAHLNERKQP